MTTNFPIHELLVYGGPSLSLSFIKRGYRHIEAFITGAISLNCSSRKCQEDLVRMRRGYRRNEMGDKWKEENSYSQRSGFMKTIGIRSAADSLPKMP